MARAQLGENRLHWTQEGLFGTIDRRGWRINYWILRLGGVVVSDEFGVDFGFDDRICALRKGSVQHHGVTIQLQIRAALGFRNKPTRKQNPSLFVVKHVIPEVKSISVCVVCFF